MKCETTTPEKEESVTITLEQLTETRWLIKTADGEHFFLDWVEARNRYELTSDSAVMEVLDRAEGAVEDSLQQIAIAAVAQYRKAADAYGFSD